MKDIQYRVLTRGITLAVLAAGAGCIVAPPGPPGPPPPPGRFVSVDVVDVQGYHHQGYYDDHHQWHGWYYDANHVRHDDPPDWHR